LIIKFKYMNIVIGVLFVSFLFWLVINILNLIKDFSKKLLNNNSRIIENKHLEIAQKIDEILQNKDIKENILSKNIETSKHDPQFGKFVRNENLIVSVELFKNVVKSIAREDAELFVQHFEETEKRKELQGIDYIRFIISKHYPGNFKFTILILSKGNDMHILYENLLKLYETEYIKILEEKITNIMEDLKRDSCLIALIDAEKKEEKRLNDFVLFLLRHTKYLDDFHRLFMYLKKIYAVKNNIYYELNKYEGDYGNRHC